MSPLVLSGWYVQYMLILTPLCCLQVEELLYFSLSVAQLQDLSLWHHHYRVSAVQPWYWRWAGIHEIISMNCKWAGVLINMNPWKHEWFWRRLVGPPLSDYITCMWHVCTSMFSLLFCMLSPPPPYTHTPPLSLILPLPGEQHGLQASVWSEFQHQCLSTSQTPGMLLPRNSCFPSPRLPTLLIFSSLSVSKLAVQSHRRVTITFS